jgi:DNA-binding PadR family transcriptional regulator
MSQSTVATELTLFQHELLYGLAETGATHGLGLRDRVEDRFEGPIHHGRLYPNLTELVEMGLVKKRSLDGRTNEYELTEEGQSLITSEAERRSRIAAAMSDDETQSSTNDQPQTSGDADKPTEADVSLPDGWTSDDVREFVESDAPQTSLGELAREMGVTLGRARTITVALGLYGDCVEVSEGVPER